MFYPPTLPGSLGQMPALPPLPVSSNSALEQPSVSTPSPASQGTIWAIQRIAREFDAWAATEGLEVSPEENQPGRREFIELGLACLVFSDPRACWNALVAGKLTDLIRQAEDIVWEMPIDQQLEMQRHFNAELARINSLNVNAAAQS